MENEFESTKGKISYEFLNNNQPKTLLLIHGFMEDREIWNELKEKLNANVLIVDLLGFGKSIPNSSFKFSIYEQALAIHELLTFLKPQNLYVLGHSMGGYVALELSLLFTKIHIGLLHSTCVNDNAERKINRNKTIEILEREPSIFIREFYWNLFAEHNKTKFSDIIEILKQKAEKIPVINIIETLKALRDRKDHSNTWKKADGENIIIGGAYDKLLNKGELEELAYIGEADWAELEESAHMGFYEEPSELRGIVRYWMELK